MKKKLYSTILASIMVIGSICGVAIPVYAKEETKIIDGNDSYDTATYLDVNGSYSDVLSDSNDVDFYKLIPDSNGKLSINFGHVYGESSHGWKVIIYKYQDGEYIELSDTVIKLEDSEKVELPFVGVQYGCEYYIKVQNYNWDAVNKVYTIKTTFIRSEQYEREENDSYNNSSKTLYMKVVEKNYYANTIDVVATKHGESFHIGSIDSNAVESTLSYNFTEDGLYTVAISAKDFAGNVAKAKNITFTIDKTNPEIVITGVNDGEIAKQLGLEGGAKTCAEDIMVSRDCMIALETGAKVSIQHISSGVAVDTVRFAKSLGAKVYAEAAPHHFTLSEEDVLKHKSLAKMNPPLRSEKDKQKIIEGLKDNTIEIIATDHAPHTNEEKNRDFAACPSGIIGLETSLALSITSLVKNENFTLMEVLEKMTINPAALYKLNRGYIEEGAIADIVIFDENEKWIVKDFDSKSSNSPFINEELTGKVKYTISEGKIVYTDK